MKQKFKHIAILFVLLIGVLGKVFANNLVYDASKISVEKRAVGAESIHALEILSNDPFITKIGALEIFSDPVAMASGQKIIIDGIRTQFPPATEADIITKVNKLFGYFQQNPNLIEALSKDEGLIKAWETVINHRDLRKDLNILSKASSVIEKGHISTDDITEILRVNSGLGQRAEAVCKLLDDLDHLALYKDRPGFSNIISSLKADWINGAGADGANWVIAAVKKEGTDVFPSGKTSFEINKPNGRIYDAIVSDPPSPPKFFEFKSYSSIPPANFADQFTKDLNNAEITNLDQLKWIFDKAKLDKANHPPDYFEMNMKAAINNLDLTSITSEVLLKFNVASKPALKAKIISEFNTIFSLK